MTACRPQPNFCVKQIYAFEVLSATEWNTPHSVSFIPNYFVDITRFFQKKLDSIDAYSLEMREEPHSRSFAHVETLARHRGYTVGLELAEAFILLRNIKV